MSFILKSFLIPARKSPLKTLLQIQIKKYYSLYIGAWTLTTNHDPNGKRFKKKCWRFYKRNISNKSLF